MCEKCVRKSKRLGLPNTRTHGQIKALAQSFLENCTVGLYDQKTNLAMEGHFWKICRALTNKKRYNRQKEKKIDR